jgi:hypothetical protein
MNKIGLLLFLLPSIFLAQETKQTTEWFADAKLGIFIHWGMYAVDGTSESWAFHNKSVIFFFLFHIQGSLILYQL